MEKKLYTICNPININYQYQNRYFGRESADPAVVLYKDMYYLFASHGSGYWISSDLADWEFIPVDLEKQPEFRLFAPAVVVVGERMYLTHSEGGSVLYSDNPRDPDSWVNIGRPFIWNDPAFLLDDDGFVYVYDGLSNNAPLHAAKLDPNDNMRVVEGPVDIFASDAAHRGFERKGDYNELEDSSPYFEGAWVNKINGKYYLTYAVPGTEFSTYADGCAVSDSPMGPFVYCENSPVAYKATGFMRGCGHGCLFADKNGNYWKMDTVSISRNHLFERRLCLLPAKISANGLLYTNTYRGDYPMLAPHETKDPFTSSDAGWHLLSLGKNIRCSTVLDAEHAPTKAADENMKTWWSAETGNPGEWLEMDLGKVCDVYALQVNFADQDIENTHGRGHGFSYRYLIEISADGSSWETCIDCREDTDDFSHPYYQLDEKTKIRYIRITNHGSIPAGGKFALSGLRVFGHGCGQPPAAAPVFQAIRCTDSRNMDVSWEAVPGADGYTVRFGIHPDELYLHWQIIGETSVNIGCLTKGVTYYVTVDAYNDSGIIYGNNIAAL